MSSSLIRPAMIALTVLAVVSSCAPALAAVALAQTNTPDSGVWLQSSPAAPLQPHESQAGPPAALLRNGWPVNLQSPGAGFPYTPTLFDADGDGADEIFLTGGNTFGLRGDGTFLPGWPVQEHPYMGYGTNANKPGPSIADLEGDGDFEILWTERDWYAGSAHMWTFNAKEFDGTDLPNFPHTAPEQSSNALDTPFVLGDTDGDGDLEAWGPHTLGNTGIHYRVTGFDHLGNLLFTTDLDPTENILDLYFGDVDGDGPAEMFAVSQFGTTLRLYLFASNGSIRPGYPIQLHALGSSYLPFGPPVPVDLDDDGDLEILFGVNGGTTSRAFCKHHDGTDYPGFPIVIATSSQLFYLCLGDITGDGEPELIATDNHLSSNYRVHAIDIATGAPLIGWPYAIATWPHGFPAVADVDGNGLQDVIVSNDGGQVCALATDGTLLPGYPHTMVTSSISGVGVGDIDGDGLFELVSATWNGYVYAWDTNGPALPGRADWPMRGVDARNTGIFRQGLDPASVPQWTQTSRPQLMIYPNPLLGSGQILIDPSLGQGTVEILDAGGRVIERLDWRGQRSLPWRVGGAYASGAYWARLTAGDRVARCRFLVIR